MWSFAYVMVESLMFDHFPLKISERHVDRCEGGQSSFYGFRFTKKKEEINGKHPFKVGSTYSTLRQSLNWPKIEEIRRPPKYFLFWAIASFREAISDSTFRNWKRFEESTSTWNDELVMINWIFCRGSINTPFICSIHDWKDRIFDEMFAADDQLINWCDGNQRSWRRCD